MRDVHGDRMEHDALRGLRDVRMDLHAACDIERLLELDSHVEIVLGRPEPIWQVIRCPRALGIRQSCQSQDTIEHGSHSGGLWHLDGSDCSLCEIMH